MFNLRDDISLLSKGKEDKMLKLKVSVHKQWLKDTVTILKISPFNFKLSFDRSSMVSC